MKKKKLKGKEAITTLLRMISEEGMEAGELFEQWAWRRKYSLDPEDRLALNIIQAQREHWSRMAYLRRKKLITTKKIERRLLVELSNEGRTELLKRNMQERPRLPDGYVCLVIFDIPVDARKGRDAFRHFLKGAGFQIVQMSVWQTDRDVREDVEKFVTSARIQKWVMIYLAKKQFD